MLIKKRFPLRLRGDLAPTDRYGTPRALFTPRIFLQVPVRDDSQTTVRTVSSGGNSSTSSEKPKTLWTSLNTQLHLLTGPHQTKPALATLYPAPG
jgi:hypothetical protein